jgi:drug/metabolite transporter (DMT)-like permease
MMADEIGGTRDSLSGVIFLLLAAMLWGSTIVVIKQVDLPPSMINLGRFALAAAALAPFARRDRRLWRIGAELSVWLFIA